MDRMQVNMAENTHPTPPSDSMQHDASPQPATPGQERIRYLPEWEVPIHPPKHRRRASESLFTRLFQIPSPTITLPDALKRHQTALSPRPRTQSRGRSTPIDKNDISSPFGFTHTSTGNQSPISSMARLQKEVTLGTPAGSGPLLPIHNAGPRYDNPSAVTSPGVSTFTPSPPSSPLQQSQTQRHDHAYDQESRQTRYHEHIYDEESPRSPDNDHVYDQESPQTPDEKTARITSEQPSQQSTPSLGSIFPRIKNHFSSTMTSAALAPSPLDSGSHNPHTPDNQFHSPRALGFLGSSPPNANPDRGHRRYESAGNPTLESGGYGSRESQTVEKPLFPINLPPKRRRTLFIIIPLATILLLALILGLGLGLGLRSRSDNTNRISRGGASNGDNDGSGNLGTGNDGSSTTVPSTFAPFPTSTPSSISVSSSVPSTAPTVSPDPNPNSSSISKPSATPDSSSIGPNPDPQPTIVPIPNEPALPSTLYPAPDSSPASPETSIWPVPTPTPDNPNPDSSPNPNPSTEPNPSPMPEPTPRPNDPAASPAPNPAPTPPEEPNEPYEPGQPDQEAPQYGNPNPNPEPKPTPTNGNTVPDDNGNGNGNGNDNGPSPPTGTGTGTGDNPRPQPSDLPLPPPFSTNVGPFKGNLLAYNAVGVGACGEKNTDDDLIGAIAWEVFDAVSTLVAGDSALSYGGSKNPLGNPNDNPLCGRRIQVFLDNGQQQDAGTGIIVRIVDRCTSCLPTELGLSPGVFAALGDENALLEGKARGLWEWVS
ncbi:hypothetical protein V8F33_000832 [Rhypophila sp. PSN 637]